MSGRRKNAAAIAVVAIVVVAGLAAFFLVGPGRYAVYSSTTNSCMLPGGANPSRETLQKVSFGAVTEYSLPLSSRWSNAVVAAPDGSVWFGEQSLPGVGHLYVNGTLVEYPWPSAEGTQNTCGYKTGIWGIEVWDGMVWATDSDENALVGVNQTSGKTTVVNVTGAAPQPYTLAPAPDGSLWFTSLSPRAVLGRLSPDLSVTAYAVNLTSGEVPVQVDFVNSTYAYFVALNPVEPYGHLYSFDPEAEGGAINAVQLGGEYRVLEPSSLSYSGGLVWVTEHGTSDVVALDTASGNWTVYPTSTVNYTTTTLPYFVDASGQGVWFNEHYANRIAVINSSAETLTEYSEADPPVENGSLIQNDLTIAHGHGGLWFTSVTGNYVGFVNESARPPFTLSLQGADSASVAPGVTANLRLEAMGSWSRPLLVQVSDSEDYGARPYKISIAPSAQQIQPGTGPAQLRVAVTPQTGLAPGRYTVAVTVSDGLVSQTSYFFLNVS